MSLHSEIFQQPEVLAGLLDSQGKLIDSLARAIQQRNVRYVFLVARGTSDNAARYANYLMGAFNRLPIALATPSLFTLYQKPPRLQDALVIGVSQSGKSPDIVSVLEEGKRQGCLTLSITNAPESPLAKAADFVIDIQAGVEGAVAATKSYTAELMALAMLSVAMEGNQQHKKELEAVPEWISKVLQLDDHIASLANRYLFMNHCIVLGRGYNYSTAFEWSLKMKELAYVVAEPYSSADFRHGPIAVVDRAFPVMAVASQGETYPDMLELLQRLKKEKKAELLVISDQPEAVNLAQSPILMPKGIPEWVSPIVNIVPAQLFSYHLTRTKGYDTESPRGLTKVTETQ
ncbi:MAG TPA: SIS domain-containing protein [Anaerolineaceae bacterium]|nr:SIS domain-containing protein [Anaerolineaceae bacterium]HPN53776.1 SIS domain-containing protein [Anaerolineaceae bacterium]